MHTCIPSHGLKRSWHSCPRRVNAGNKSTPSMHHPWRRNVTNSMDYKTVTYAKISPKIVKPKDLDLGTQKKTPPWLLQATAKAKQSTRGPQNTAQPSPGRGNSWDSSSVIQRKAKNCGFSSSSSRRCHRATSCSRSFRISKAMEKPAQCTVNCCIT